MTTAKGTGGSLVVSKCQICGSVDLESVLFLGYLPPVNKMVKIGVRPYEQPGYPAELLHCPKCQLVQLGLIVDPEILFPPEYPYTSSTTKILRENFADLYKEVQEKVGLNSNDLVVDIGSNDGNLLSNFVGSHKVQGVTPEQIGKLAIQKGIPTLIAYFGPAVVDEILEDRGVAKLVTATNVFAHMENVHDVVEQILRLLAPDGVFISESHYWMSLVETLQYDTVYHEHMRYYSLTSLSNLLRDHGLEVFHARRIPTHGGSIRVYAGRKGKHRVQTSVAEILKVEEATILGPKLLADFKRRVLVSKLKLNALLGKIRERGERVWGISAPSRASTLVHYAGLDDGILECVVETPGSYKIGNYVPGTVIPILEESVMYKEQPGYALLLSWHIADELMPKIREKGFRGKFIVPLPEPRLVD